MYGNASSNLSQLSHEFFEYIRYLGEDNWMAIKPESDRIKNLGSIMMMKVQVGSKQYNSKADQ